MRTKTIQLSHREGNADVERKARQTQKFIDQGKTVQIHMRIKVAAHRVNDEAIALGTQVLDAFIDSIDATRGKVVWRARDARVTLTPREVPNA